MEEQRLTLEAAFVVPTINSKGCLTDEYHLRFKCGAEGRGSAPRGETRSRYEPVPRTTNAQSVIEQLFVDGIIGREQSQKDFDEYLTGNASQFGPGAVFSLSCAFFEAGLVSSGRWSKGGRGGLPRFCLNILNGGQHAYTNPVLSDFHEFLLVPKHGKIGLILEDHRAIQAQVQAQLSRRETTVVNGNVVHLMGGQGNRGSIEFLIEILDGLGLSSQYGLMIDAAAAYLWDGSAYVLDIAEQRTFSPQEFEEFWFDILNEFPVAFLEDPFAEHDLERWRSLASGTSDCRVVGDDVHCGDAGRVKSLLTTACMTGLMLKPDQAGTISKTLAALEVAKSAGVPVILSHRSISTDSLVLAHLMVHHEIELAKFGPLLSDFTSILKMNEILRTTHDIRPVWQAESTASE